MQASYIERGKPTDLLRESPLLEGLDPKLGDKIAGNPVFLTNGGFTLLLLSFNGNRGYLNEDRNHVLRSLMQGNNWMFHEAYRHYKAGNEVDSPSSLNYEGQVLIDLYLNLYLRSQEKLGMGYKVEDLARQICRPAVLGLERSIPSEVTVNRYVPYTDPKLSTEYDYIRGRTSIDQRVSSGYQAAMILINQGLRVDPYLLETLNEDVYLGLLPEVSITAYADNVHEIPWGVDLSAMPPEEISAFADTAEYCPDGCQYYHGHAKDLKDIGDLIAPVDARLFGEHLLGTYNIWEKNDSRNGRFSVLIPAQADETTIGGIIDYCCSNGLFADNIRENFSFEVADLCITPLLRIYAELKRRDLLEIANITSTNVFQWAQSGKKFDFICTDHFIELFPSEGEYSQDKVLSSLTGSLKPGGRLVLTTRCGTIEHPLTKGAVLGNFYEKVDRHIGRILDELEEEKNNPSQDAQKLSTDSYLLSALLLYRKLREVHPFKTQAELNFLLSSIDIDTDACQTQRLRNDKVKIMITRK